MLEHETIAFVVRGKNGTGVLHQLTGVIARHSADISQVAILESHPES